MRYDRESAFDVEIQAGEKMAREEHDRADLFAEVTGLSPRVEFRSGTETLVAGFRGAGAPSFYLGQELMIGFTSALEVRRLFVDAVLYRAENGRSLTRLERERTPEASHLLSRRLTEEEARRLLERIRTDLSRWSALLKSGTATVVRAFPPGDESAIAQRVRETLATAAASALPIADGMLQV